MQYNACTFRGQVLVLSTWSSGTGSDHLVITHANDEETESDLGRIPQLCIRRCKAQKLSCRAKTKDAGKLFVCPLKYSTSRMQMRLPLCMQILHVFISCLDLLGFTFGMEPMRLPWPCTILMMESGPFAFPFLLRDFEQKRPPHWRPLLGIDSWK